MLVVEEEEDRSPPAQYIAKLPQWLYKCRRKPTTATMVVDASGAGDATSTTLPADQDMPSPCRAW